MRDLSPRPCSSTSVAWHAWPGGPSLKGLLPDCPSTMRLTLREHPLRATMHIAQTLTTGWETTPWQRLRTDRSTWQMRRKVQKPPNGAFAPAQTSSGLGYSIMKAAAELDSARLSCPKLRASRCETLVVASDVDMLSRATNVGNPT